MHALALFMLLAVGGLAIAEQATAAEQPAGGPLGFTVKDIKGNDVDLKQYKGKVVLVVNVASKCGHTPQYVQLERIYREYKDQGFVVLGFPANDFGQQEPGTNEEIATFCSTTYNVSFPMFSKLSVKGDAKAPLYQFLTSKELNGEFGGEIGWNFTKFLIGRNGQTIARFDSGTKPDAPAVTAAIEKQLASNQ